MSVRTHGQLTGARGVVNTRRLRSRDVTIVVHIERSARIREWFEIIECVQLVHCPPA
jgi:hypothetical protein